MFLTFFSFEIIYYHENLFGSPIVLKLSLTWRTLHARPKNLAPTSRSPALIVSTTRGTNHAPAQEVEIFSRGCGLILLAGQTKGEKSPDLLAPDLPSSLSSTQRHRSPHRISATRHRPWPQSPHRRSATRRRPWPQSPPVLVCLHLNFPPCLKFFRSGNSRSKSNFFCRLCPSMSRKGRRT